MNIMEIVLILLLASLLGWAVGRSVRKARRGGGCCGEREQTEARVSIQDRNKSHYPFQVTLQIGGMTCENCARRVENALNSLEGIWADVRILNHQATVRAKKKPDETTLRQAVQNAGYVVLGQVEGV
ncbi:MAG: heavy-metal-associated domain-containing protein [Clostridia bacterium]|nr:heavy-metal-associated domain-containing protein [Clostridia bacterium]MBQ9252181.1 heavy-metal-associated domain-containing protein [Clostridia bacterium]